MGVGELESAKICESEIECLWRRGARRGYENICGAEMGDRRSSEDTTRERATWASGKFPVHCVTVPQ